MPRCLLTFLALLLCSFSTRASLPPEQARALFAKVSPSLVVIQYTWDAEFGRQELIGQGLVVREEGVVMATLSIFPRGIPDDQMKDFKIIIPGDEEQEFPATFLGRDDRSDVAFLKTKEAQKWPAIKFEDAPVKIRDTVYSVGMLPKEAGYKTYYTEAFVSSILRGPTPYVLVNAEGVGSVSSPVFNEEGKAIGWVPAQEGQRLLLTGGGASESPRGRRGGGPPRPAADDSSVPNPARFFVPSRELLASLSDIPTGEPLQLPWLGARLEGLNKDVAELYHLKGQNVAQVGEVIPNASAAKAGLKPNDKIVKINGAPLERGDEPLEVAQILNRKVRRMHVGDKVTLSVVRERDKPPVDVVVTLEEQPKQANLARRFFAEDLGMAIRETVWEDLYSRRLPQETTGVVVAYVRQSSSAATAQLRNGDLITELNTTPVKDLDSFKTQYKKFREEHPRDVVVLVVIRDANTQVIRIEPPQ